MEEEEDDDTEEEEEEETGHKTAPHDLCKPAQSKCISRLHKDIRRATLDGNLQEKGRGPD